MSDLWLPRSTCGVHCLPLADHRGAIRTAITGVVAAGRLAATAFVLLSAVLAVPVLAVLPALPGHRLVRVQRAYARAVLRALGVRHTVSGRLPERHALLVANHVSWLDVLVILAHAPASLLAKREVRDWPVIGRLARTLGTVFIDRTRPKSLPATVEEVAGRLSAGGVVAVFPEGTTWCGRNGGRFRPAMFQAAIDAGAPVVPVRLGFSLDGVPTTLAAFLGEDTLYASVKRVVNVRGMTVSIKAYPMLHPTATASRRVLARATSIAMYRVW